MGGNKSVSVPVDEAAIKRADEALAAEIDREVAARIEEEKSRMDAAQLKAALEAADKKAGDALARNAELEKKLADSENATATLRKEFDAMRGEFKAQADAAKAAGEEEVLRRSRLIAAARGLRGDALEGEAKRLAGLGAGAVEELMRFTAAPTADPLHLQMVGVGDSAPSKVASGVASNGARTFTLTDSKMTIPERKVF